MNAAHETPLQAALEQVGLHDHLCSMYETSEEHFAVAVSFIRIGLGRGEKCLYIADDGTDAVLRDAMHAGGIDVERGLASGSLVLSPALRWYVAREARRGGLDCTLRIAELEERLPPTVEISCFRLVQEAITNVLRHAQARTVTVTLAQAPGAVRLEVSDDGRGFDLAEALRRAAAGRSQGLSGMQERVSLAGGELTIDTAPGRGTNTRAHFPRSG